MVCEKMYTMGKVPKLKDKRKSVRLLKVTLLISHEEKVDLYNNKQEP